MRIFLSIWYGDQRKLHVFLLSNWSFNQIFEWEFLSLWDQMLRPPLSNNSITNKTLKCPMKNPSIVKQKVQWVASGFHEGLLRLNHIKSGFLFGTSFKRMVKWWWTELFKLVILAVRYHLTSVHYFQMWPPRKKPRTKEDFIAFCTIVLEYTKYEAMRNEVNYFYL